MSNEKLEKQVKKYLGVLDHFWGLGGGGGWPISTVKQKDIKPLMKLTAGALYVDDKGRVAKEPHYELPKEVEVTMWKLKYQELENLYENMYWDVKKALEKY